MIRVRNLLKRPFRPFVHYVRESRAAIVRLNDTIADVQSMELSSRRPAVYLGNSRAIVETSWGSRIIFRTDDYIMAPELACTGDYEPGVTALFKNLIRPGDVVVDVGANIGYFSVRAGSLVGPTGRVLALEPQEKSAEILQINLVINGMWGHSTVDTLAAHSCEGELTFYLRSMFSSNSSVSPVLQVELDELRDSQTEITVHAIDLDTYLDRRSIPHTAPNVLKVDVEGAELFVLRGARAVVEAAQPAIVLEWSPGQQRRAGYEPEDLVQFFDNHAMSVSVIDAQDGRLAEISTRALTSVEYANLLLRPHGRAI